MKRWWLLATSVLLAVVLRWAAIQQIDTPRATEDRSIASHLADGRGFSFAAFGYFGPTSIRPPIYPMILAGLGIETRSALWLNTFFASVSVVVAYSVGRAVFASDASAQMIAAGVAVLPTMLYAATFDQGLPLAILLLLIAVRLSLSERWALAIPAGTFAGLAILTESVLILPILAISLWIASRRPASALLMLAGIFVLTTPWLYRNAIVHSQLTGVTNELWRDAFVGNHPGATGSVHLPMAASATDRLSPIESDRLRNQPESARTAIYRGWTLDFVSEQPLAFARLCLIRIVKTLWLDWDHPQGLNVLNVASRSILMAGSLVAFGTMIRCRQICGLALVLLIGLTLATAFTLAEARNSVFVDLGQLLAIGWLIDPRRID
jgi:hypothetical protein